MAAFLTLHDYHAEDELHLRSEAVVAVRPYSDYHGGERPGAEIHVLTGQSAVYRSYLVMESPEQVLEMLRSDRDPPVPIREVGNGRQRRWKRAVRS